MRKEKGVIGYAVMEVYGRDGRPFQLMDWDDRRRTARETRRELKVKYPGTAFDIFALVRIPRKVRRG